VKEDLRLGSIILVFCGFLWFYAIPYHIKGFLPALFPRCLTVAMLIPCVLLFIKGLRARRAGEIQQAAVVPAAVTFRALLVVPIMVVYIFLIDIIGFYVTTGLFILIFLLFFGARKPLILIIFPIAMPLVVYAVIGKILHFPFPEGMLF